MGVDGLSSTYTPGQLRPLHHGPHALVRVHARLGGIANAATGERWLVLLLLFCFTQAYQTFLLGGSPSEGTDEVLTEDQAHVLRLGWGGVYVGVLVLALVRWRAVFSVMAAAPWLTLLLVLFPLSTAWSVAPEETLRRGVAMLATGLFGLYLAARFDHRELVRLLVQALGAAIILSLLAAVLIPAIGVESGVHAGLWRGVFAHKNELSLYAILYIVFLLLLAMSGQQPKTWTVVRVVLGGFLFAKSLAVGSFLSVLFVGAVIALVMLKRAQRVVGAAAGTLLISVALLLVTLMILGVAYADDIVILLGRDATWSGRTLLWDELLELIERRPLLGYGYGAIWRTSTPYLQTVSMAIDWTPAHGHNGYLDLMVALGTIGTAVFAVLLLSAIVRLWATLAAGDATAVYASAAVLAFSLFYSLVESNLFAEGQLLSVLLIVTLATLSRRDAGGLVTRVRCDRLGGGSKCKGNWRPEG